MYCFTTKSRLTSFVKPHKTLHSQYVKDIEAYKEMLKALPADTFLGRFGINAEIKHTRRKLNNVLEAISAKETSFGRKRD